ncbi:ABC transporter ATP-binding protein [Aliikangiella coralliicola]|uniref:ABC transporter ATP-binding protein n=1 Tax=Aliikangiella coralliicola TaxID=2592383 RepID=A0A545UJK6_9GAMM|nr:ABC transporter ATP-binding protein [Aliikangiella coralliicola]TQV89647.1 ABC transporter ATP-binding protein [Aliikangiella coralliicola]
MIKLNKVSRIFRTQDIETTALNEINLKVDEGEFLMIMGASGCGKSTLLSILGMLDSVSAGDYFFCNQNISGFSEKRLADIRKENIGFVFQSFNLIDDLTVFENVELTLQYQGIRRAERKQRTREILTRVGLDHRADHLPQHLSGGQQQRVSVARALVINPKIILADEPTGNLDSKNGEEIMQMLRQLNNEGTTIVMVTHSEADAQYGSRTIRLFDGQVISDKAETQVNESNNFERDQEQTREETLTC